MHQEERAVDVCAEGIPFSFPSILGVSVLPSLLSELGKELIEILDKMTRPPPDPSPPAYIPDVPFPPLPSRSDHCLCSKSASPMSAQLLEVWSAATRMEGNLSGAAARVLFPCPPRGSRRLPPRLPAGEAIRRLALRPAAPEPQPVRVGVHRTPLRGQHGAPPSLQPLREAPLQIPRSASAARSVWEAYCPGTSRTQKSNALFLAHRAAPGGLPLRLWRRVLLRAHPCLTGPPRRVPDPLRGRGARVLATSS